MQKRYVRWIIVIGTVFVFLSIASLIRNHLTTEATAQEPVLDKLYYLPIIFCSNPIPTPTPVPPPPTDSPPPPPMPAPQYQFVPAPWYAGDRNDAIVRFYGYLRDTNGIPVNGFSVKATCGDFMILSFPSGPSPFAPDWPPGWYDLVTDPVSCNWTLQVVEYQCNTPGFFDPHCEQYETFSDAIPITTDVSAGETIIVADWIKIW
jgi:hypothetical protein